MGSDVRATSSAGVDPGHSLSYSVTSHVVPLQHRRTDLPLAVRHGRADCVNTVVFFAVVGMAPDMATVEVVQPYILEYGNGLQPHQWLTANFLHADIVHLVGNMLALWGFGLIVEGKIGWWRFLTIYLGMGIGQCMLEQMFVPSSLAIGSLGASGVIFGLMAMSLLWAP